MKLRNKLEYIGEDKPKGRIGTLIGYDKQHDAIKVEFEGEDGGIITSLYYSLAELNAEWEDYTPQEPQEEIGKQLISSLYDEDFYWADEKQQEAFREFCREEDSRPENQNIPTDVYSDNAQCLSKDFGGVLSGNDRPRNMSEFNAWRSGLDFLKVREENEQLGRERWQHFVGTFGLEKFVEHKEPLIKDETIRKAVRAWAEVNGIEEVGVVQQREITTFCDDNTDITFYGNLPGLIDGAEYTIAELCGEEDNE